MSLNPIDIYRRTLNPEQPDIYNYLYRCTIEQIGDHTHTGISSDPKEPTHNDINFLKQFFDKFKQTNQEHNEFIQNLGNNYTLHQTRDCQVLETGYHFASLTYRFEFNDDCYVVEFYIQFKQTLGGLPKDSSKINVTFTKFIRTKHINISYHVYELYSNEFDVNFFSDIPFHYNTLPIEPIIEPDACTIS